MSTASLQPINLSMPLLREKGARWLVEMVQYISENPQIIVNRFIRSGITGAIDQSIASTDEGNDCDK